MNNVSTLNANSIADLSAELSNRDGGSTYTSAQLASQSAVIASLNSISAYNSGASFVFSGYWHNDSSAGAAIYTNNNSDAYLDSGYVTNDSGAIFLNNQYSSIKFNNVSFSVNGTGVGTRYMFNNLSNLKSLDLGNSFNTSNVYTMSYMFAGMNNLTNLNLGNQFDTSNVRDMSKMFSGLNNLTSLNLGNKFNTSNVTNMNEMFGNLFGTNMSSVTSLNLGNQFNTSNVTNMNSMFLGLCSYDNNIDRFYVVALRV